MIIFQNEKKRPPFDSSVLKFAKLKADSLPSTTDVAASLDLGISRPLEFSDYKKGITRIMKVPRYRVV